MKRRIPQQNRNKLLPIYLVGAIVVLVVGFMIYRGVRKEVGNPIVLSASDVPRISAADAIAAVRDQGAILLDTRTAAQYETSHALGSISMPFVEIESWVDTLDKDAWYINYCTWPAENTSAGAAFIMLKDGYRKVDAILGGYEALIAAGYPTEP